MDRAVLFLIILVGLVLLVLILIILGNNTDAGWLGALDTAALVT